MAINFNDLNNSGIIGLQPLEGMALPVNQNMDQAFLFKSAEEKALDQIEDLRKDQNVLTSPVGGDINLLKDINELNYNKYQNLENKIQDLKQQFPEDADIQQAFLTNQYGFPLTASLSDSIPMGATVNDTSGILSVDQITADPNRNFYNKLFSEGLYTRTPEDTGLRIDPDLVDKFRENNPELVGRTDAEIMTLFSDKFRDVLPPSQIPKVGFGQKIKDFITSGGITGNILRGIGSLLKQDPRFSAIRNYYRDPTGASVGLDSIGRIQSGLMAGYSPVSGGFLNMITGGRFGDPTRYGLQRAYQKRIDTIKKTLKKKESDVLTARLAQLEAEKAKELQALQTAQRAKDRADIDRAYREETGDKYSGGESRKGDDTSYNDPFDPGGGE
tara:strand:- start:10012 stop:11172 length:1161 start_codon:yes stop_codon:yes gene_type:complete